MNENTSERNGYQFGDLSEKEEDYFTLTEEIDHQILMHRDAHFAGDFSVMLEYYAGENIGVNPEFPIKRIEYLAQVEKELSEDLATKLLTGAEAEKVAKARAAYRAFKEIYAVKEEKNRIPRLIADLVLSEEKEPVEEVAAIVAEGRAIVPALINILRSDDSYDPLFPGYGYAPMLAMVCLGALKDPDAIVPLFETLNREFLFGEETLLQAFSQIGEPSKQFLLKQIKNRPLTHDNVHAAFALASFPKDTQVSIACFEQLQDKEVQSKPLLSTYLLCNCLALKETFYRKPFMAMANDPAVSEELRKEIGQVTASWSKE